MLGLRFSAASTLNLSPYCSHLKFKLLNSNRYSDSSEAVQGVKGCRAEDFGVGETPIPSNRHMSHSLNSLKGG